MKKIVWLIILLLIPFMVGAEGKDLYKDLRQMLLVIINYKRLMIMFIFLKEELLII